jgi:hypothetical protein
LRITNISIADLRKIVEVTQEGDWIELLRKSAKEKEGAFRSFYSPDQTHYSSRKSFLVEVILEICFDKLISIDAEIDMQYPLSLHTLQPDLLHINLENIFP